MFFLISGKYRRLSMIDVFSKIRDEYGTLVKFPGAFGSRSITMSFDVNDIEKVYRTEGQWPLRRRGFESLAYFRENYRPDIFKNTTGLITDQGQQWATMRSKVSTLMLQPKIVKTYIPQVDAVAQEFLDIIKVRRDENNELPAEFGQMMNAWSLESIGCIALDQRLGVLHEQDENAQTLIRNTRDMFRLSYELDIQQSIWRYIKTPKFKRLMKIFDENAK